MDPKHRRDIYSEKSFYFSMPRSNETSRSVWRIGHYQDPTECVIFRGKDYKKGPTPRPHPTSTTLLVLPLFFRKEMTWEFSEGFQ